MIPHLFGRTDLNPKSKTKNELSSFKGLLSAMNRRQALKLAFLRRLVNKSRLPSDSAWNRFIEQRSFGQEGPSLKARRKLCAVFLLRTHPACRHDNKCPANGVKFRIQACSNLFLIPYNTAPVHATARSIFRFHRQRAKRGCPAG